jgi:hypothetical protein
MNSSPTKTNTAPNNSRLVPLMEKVLLIALIIGVTLTTMNIDTTVTKVSLLGLAVIFFLMAYRPIDLPEEPDAQYGMPELLGLMIIPKVLWISSAISALGLALYVINLGNEGYRTILMVGGLTIAIATLLLIYFVVTGTRHISRVVPILFRALPLCLVSLYILLT